MKNILITVWVTGLLAFACGYHTGSLDEGMKQRSEINQLTKDLARFHNKQVFDHALKVSRITGTPLFQVLTGRKGD